MGAVLSLVEQNFVEDKSIRDQYIEKIGVLSKVKMLSLLPDEEHMTVKMAAEFYEVDYKTIATILNRHKNEFESDGVNTITSKDEAFFKLKKALPNSQFVVKLLPKRAILRIGMLLRDSEVSVKVRNYLLNIEEQSSQESKEVVTGAWADSDLVLLNKILNIQENTGINKMAAIKNAAKELNRNPNNVYQKVHYITKRHGSLNQFIVENGLMLQQENNECFHGNFKNYESNKDELISINDKLSNISKQLNIVSELNGKVNRLEVEVNNNRITIIEQEGLIKRKNKLLEKYKKDNQVLINDLNSLRRILLTDESTGTKNKELEEGIRFITDKHGCVSIK
ncbi:hypothetical protein SAMN04487895_101690 [Paenibacillus sophorae]|uniref:Uncharacterized protein n=1 Tax=Paenibacillus sophorae TaxID=1333845 RepID=A0A1H8H0P6_9BACL|nr:hypothetical protein [Paenibacillus sophorae]QWU14383.1 hypothetical protein KP014_20975 [Paenibacillus sophorae]SEN49058.1 hypothetical protein SAMN04487895_101690 [Paenibacillus sophorae]